MKTTAFVGAILLSMGLTGTAMAIPVVSLNNPGSTTLHEVWVEPGETFNMEANLGTDDRVGVLRFALQADAGNVFDVSEMTDYAPWRSRGTMVSGVDPVSGPGVFTCVDNPPYGPGSITVVGLLMAVEPTAPLGSYGIDALAVRWALTPFTEDSPGQAGPTFVVHVVPEPTMVTLLIIAVLVGCSRRAKR